MRSDRGPRARRLPALGALLTVAGAATEAPCDEGCLRNIMQDYLRHVVSHDPAGLPVAANVVAVENAVPTPLGSGVWKDIAAVRISDTVADATTGQVVSYSAVDASKGPGVLFLRLKLVDKKITESEIIFNGTSNAFSNPANLREPDILYDAVVPAERRVGRAQLLAIVNSYMDSISEHDGSKTPFSYRCDRYASGGKVTNSPDHPAEREGGSCAGSMLHLTGQIVVNRRFPVIDVERGVVVAMFLIPHLERPQPGSTHAGEWFKMVDGKIRSIEEFSFGGGAPPDSGFESDVEVGTPDTPRAQNMHPSPEFLKQVLSNPPPIMTIDLPQTQAAGQLTVQSSTLSSGTFPVQNTGWGASVSPEMSWSAGPTGTQSYVLFMEDATAGMNRQGVLHWLAFNIPADTTELPEGLPKLPAGMQMGSNQAGDPAYTGPHSPAGGPVFHYHIQLFALDTRLALPAGATREAVIRAMQGHVLAKGQLVANFQGPPI